MVRLMRAQALGCDLVNTLHNATNRNDTKHDDLQHDHPQNN